MRLRSAALALAAVVALSACGPSPTPLPLTAAVRTYDAVGAEAAATLSDLAPAFDERTRHLEPDDDGTCRFRAGTWSFGNDQDLSEDEFTAAAERLQPVLEASGFDMSLRWVEGDPTFEGRDAHDAYFHLFPDGFVIIEALVESSPCDDSALS